MVEGLGITVLLLVSRVIVLPGIVDRNFSYHQMTSFDSAQLEELVCGRTACCKAGRYLQSAKKS